jgi:NAD(P)H-quinone oxidoreductase subunit 4
MDARPREVLIAACFIVLIVGIGVYPKWATQMYDVKTVALNTEMRESYIEVAKTNPKFYAKGLLESQKIAKAPVLETFE